MPYGADDVRFWPKVASRQILARLSGIDPKRPVAIEQQMEVDLDTDKLNRWLTLGANVGVLAGILLLVIEVRQNQTLLELDQKLSIADSDSIEVERFRELVSLRVQDREVAQIWSDGMAGRELDPIDQQRFSGMCRQNLWADTLMYSRSIALNRTERAQGTVYSVQRQIKENPGMLECWRAHSEGLRSRWGYSDFVDAVEAEHSK